MRIAVVHDWLDTWRGGEHLLAEVLKLVPHADLFSLVDFLDPASRARLGGRRARTSFLQHVPLARRVFRAALPLFPAAVARLDVRAYPLVISISHAVAKNVRLAEAQYHLCCCLTPMRYAWDLRDQYLAAVGASRGSRRWLADRVLDPLQRWDREGARRVDQFIAISRYIAERIRQAYGREADVVYPPVDVEFFVLPPDGAQRTGYLTGSRWVPYKRIDAIVAAFRLLPDLRLVVAGDGPEAARVRAAAGANVHFVGEVSREELRTLMQRAQAFVFAAEEDFGIMPLEAQGCGTPVIAFDRGGVAETIDSAERGGTGLFFAEQTPQAIADAIRRFEALARPIEPTACRNNALRFSTARFRSAFSEPLSTALAAARARSA